MAKKTPEESIKEHKIRIKKYLELENVSVLTGAGTSFHLGVPIIRTISEEIAEQFKKEIEEYFGDPDNQSLSPSYEDLLNCLQADRYIKHKQNKEECVKELDKSIRKMQEWLFKHCDTRKSEIHNDYSDIEQLKNNHYHYHELLIKKLLQRPNNLKRVNLFTTNYDMAFDYALDRLGVHYINGFMGVHDRYFRPEAYEYDLYYPGQSVSGKVHRAEKVLKYYKLHGSLSWIATKPSAANTYGIKEISLSDEDDYEPYKNNEIMIYPCASKKSFTLDLPYSELFRHFSQAINQPQSVLFCIGYSFYDEHINDIIYQALSIPSFTLIIVNFLDKNDEENISSNKKIKEPKKLDDKIDEHDKIEELKKLKDKRIIILDQKNGAITKFTNFVDDVMPDLYEETESDLIAKTMKDLYEKQREMDNGTA